MTGPGPSRFPQRIARFALASLLLHAALLLVLQFAARRQESPPPEAPPVQMVELQPAPAARPAAEAEPPAIEPRAATPATPTVIAPAPPAPAAEPEREERDETPEPPVTPGRPEQADRAAEGSPGSVVIPGLAYDDGAGDLADFGHAVDCADLHLRHAEECADIGPIDVAAAMAPLPADVPAEWMEEQALEAARDRRLESISQGAIPGACAPGDHDCMESLPRMRDNPAVRDALPVRQVLDALGLED